ncbi:MAG: hypothetical protein ACI8Y4_003883 [Candidatus Poriferisodalaceae bacterium]|jgi:hypothetical protein
MKTAIAPAAIKATVVDVAPIPARPKAPAAIPVAMSPVPLKIRVRLPGAFASAAMCVRADRISGDSGIEPLVAGVVEVGYNRPGTVSPDL